MSMAEKADWEDHFLGLIAFSHEFGHCNVPLQRNYTLPSGLSGRLGQWLEKQRKLRREGKLFQSFQLKLQDLVDR
jgi:hypothetical protein